MTDHPDRLTDLQARLHRGEIDRRGYLARLRTLRDAGHITARAYSQEIGALQLDVLAVRGIPSDEPAHRRRPFSRAAARTGASEDAADGPLDKNDLEAGAPTQNIGIEDAVGVAGMDDGTLPEPEYRRTDAVRLLRKIVLNNPDASYAASTAKRTAATKWAIRCYEIGPNGPTETPAPDAEAEARRFVRRIMRAHGGGVEALLEVGLDSLITDGAVAVELDVAPSLDDVRDVVPVDVTKVRWQTTTTKDGQRVVIPVYKPQSGPPKPFNLNQFAYSGLDTTVTDPHGRPWILPVLDTAPAQHKLRNTVHKVMIHQGFGRLAASVDWQKVAEQTPMTADTPEKKRAYMQKVLGGVTDKLKTLKPDDAVALYDFIELTVLGAGHGSQSVKTQELVDIYDTDNAAALKTPAAVIGRSVGVSLSTNADIHWWIYALSVEALRLHVTRVVSWAISQYLRIRGIPAYCVVEFEPIRKTDQGAEEEAAKAKQERLLAAWDAGLVDDAYVRGEMGYPAMEATAAPGSGEERAAIGGGRAAAGPLALTDDVGANTTNARSAKEKLLVGLVTTCTKCGCANLRRPNGQGRCRQCGAYLTARRSAVESADPDPAEVLAEVASDLQARGVDVPAARAYLEAYADTAAVLGFDDHAGCETCASDTDDNDPTRAEKFAPAKPNAAGAVELGQEFALPDEDDGDAAAAAWREWARGRGDMPELADLPFAILYEEEEDEKATRASARAKGWMWDPRVQGYREAANPKRILSEATVRRAVERRMTDHRQDIARLSDRLAAGDISVADWQRGIAKSLRETHLQARMLAVGGKDRMTQRHYGSVGGFIRADTDRLARFGQQVAKGELSMPQIKARAQLYGEANLRREYERGRQWAAEDAEYSLERRVLDPSAEEHCPGCTEEWELGWVELGSLQPIGGHECAARDRCHKEYRYDDKNAAPPKRSDAGDLDAAWRFEVEWPEPPPAERLPARTGSLNGVPAGVWG